MTHKYILLFFGSVLLAFSSVAQTTYLPLGSDDYYVLDRLEILSGRLSDSLRLSDKGVSRCGAIDFLDREMADKTLLLSGVDRYNMEQMISESGEWPYNGDRAKDSRVSLWHTFYTKQFDFYHVKTNDFFFVLNPIINLMATADQEQPKPSGAKSLLYINQHGVELRGRITSKIGFYSLLTDNQEYTPAFITKYDVGKVRVVPGEDFFLYSGNSGYSDYFNATGYFDFAVLKDNINISAGSGKNFIGDGIRSLFLSDNTNTSYVKITSRFGRFNYQNLYMELTPMFIDQNKQLPHTFATMHHLSVNVAKWLNVGLFESTIFRTPDCYRIGYLNPVIFSRFAGSIGDDQNKELIGFNFKALAARHLQFYGQVILDDIGASINPSQTSISNKYGAQFGGKYDNAFSIKNLDLQGEINAVRPYTYSSSDTVINYSSYNQPLAHPLGSGFIELVGIARYQPAKKVVLTLRGTYYTRGADSGKIDYGNNIFSDQATAPGTSVQWINGVTTNCIMLSANLSYQLFPNVYLDLGGAKRHFAANSAKAVTTSTGTTAGSNSETWFYFGIRMNAPRRGYDVYY